MRATENIKVSKGPWRVDIGECSIDPNIFPNRNPCQLAIWEILTVAHVCLVPAGAANLEILGPCTSRIGSPTKKASRGPA